MQQSVSQWLSPNLMARKSHRKAKEAPELDITAFLNLMVVLVPFLLVSAVFSRVTILELNTPTAGGAADAKKPKMSIEVVIREKGLEISNGKQVLGRFPKVGDKYPVKLLSESLLKLKASFPDKTDATILMEPDIQYDYLILIMDAVRSAEIAQAGQTDQEDIDSIPLFPDISIGDAP